MRIRNAVAVTVLALMPLNAHAASADAYGGIQKRIMAGAKLRDPLKIDEIGTDSSADQKIVKAQLPERVLTFYPKERIGDALTVLGFINSKMLGAKSLTPRGEAVMMYWETAETFKTAKSRQAMLLELDVTTRELGAVATNDGIARDLVATLADMSKFLLRLQSLEKILLDNDWAQKTNAATESFLTSMKMDVKEDVDYIIVPGTPARGH